MAEISYFQVMNWIRLIPLLLISLFACQSRLPIQPAYIAFTGATILDGTGKNPLTDGVLLIRQGRIVAVGTKDQVALPKHTQVRNVAGKTIIPGLINAHGHVGDVKGIDPGHYSAANVQDNLAIYARYGITTVVSLGGDKKEAVALRAVQDTTTCGRARLYIAGEVINGNTPQEAVAVVDKNHTMGVDFMKIRVDDNVGTSPKMPEDIYRAVIARSHELGYKIATHMYYLDDAKKLLEAGTDLLAHSVRDLPVDDEFIRLIKEKKIGYCPTLTRELSTFVYEDTAAFFTDPFFTKEYDLATISPLKDPAYQQKIQNNPVAQTYKRQLPVAMQNLKTLAAQGVPIVFGTDSGMPARFMGYFEHLEMQMMAEAGLTPQQIIESATKNAANYMGLKEVGTLTPGYWADFLVLDADPLTDIANIRKIGSIYIGGTEVKAK
jgi:imidazolonepropionase-like amidohydrolase